MKITNRSVVKMIAILVAIALCAGDMAYAQRGGGGGDRGGGGARAGGGRDGGGPGGVGRSGGGAQSNQGANRGGDRSGGNARGDSNRGGTTYSRGNDNYARGNGDTRGSINNGNNDRYNDRYNGTYGRNYGNSGRYTDGGRNRYNSGNGRGGAYRYSSGYRGYPSGGMGVGAAYGRYGYGYFPWYGGLGLYGGLGGVSRTFGNGVYGSGYYNGGYGNYASDGAVYQSQVAPPQQPAEDYVPQVNTTSAELAASATGTALLGVSMDSQYTAAAVVRSARSGGPAEAAGLRPGDMIASINDQSINSANDVVDLVASMQPGDRVDIQFVRPIPRSQVKAAAPEPQPGTSTSR